MFIFKMYVQNEHYSHILYLYSYLITILVIMVGDTEEYFMIAYVKIVRGNGKISTNIDGT